ncbi:MAG: TIGR02281 family clan AA aspartic protease [Alphaproteobacteria bacterium]|nr:TIGR02281 family clan AA aspartic protease [Alphaproteobacteria bacterium]MCZ6847767.1 TIGR02281 family clan AA aspartic protease [Alphaproteobacteria bacterium]
MASPWGRGPSSWIWFAIFAGGLTAMVLWLAAERGGLPDDAAGGSRIIQGIVLAAVIAAGLVHGRRIGFKGALGAGFAWIAIGAALVLGYSYRFEGLRAWQRIAGEIVPAATMRAGPRSFAVRRAADGHFYIRAEVNGTSIRFLVDTGASTTVLGPRDAARVGIDPARLSFTQRFRTANGIVRGAPVILARFKIGPVRFRDVRASVNEVPLGGPLLGISTLKLFKSWKVEDDRLTLSY